MAHLVSYHYLHQGSMHHRVTLMVLLLKPKGFGQASSLKMVMMLQRFLHPSSCLVLAWGFPYPTYT